MALSRDAILDAGEAVAMRAGIGALTLEAVAAEVGASKGGLLHHFRSKDLLLEAMVARIVDNWRADYTAAIQGASPPCAARGVLDMSLGESAEWSEACRRSSVVLIAALVHNRKLIEPVRRAYNELFAKLESDGLQEGVGEVVMLVVHGLWFEWMFELRELTPERAAAVHRAVVEILSVRGACSRSDSERKVSL